MVIGVSLLLITKAATSTIALETEAGTTTLQKPTGGGASGNSYIRFYGQTPGPDGTFWDPASNRPFSSTSLFNTPTPSSTQWFSQPVLNSLVQGDYYYGQVSTRRWYIHAGHPIWSAKDTDPTWTLNLVSPHDINARRDRPNITVSVKAPADMQVDTNDGDHVLLLVSGGKYYEVYQAVVNQGARTVTQSSGLRHWRYPDRRRL